MIVIFSIDLCKTKRNTFTLKCFTQSTGANLDGCQEEGVTFLICFRKKGGGGGTQKGRFPQKGGGGESNPGGNYVASSKPFEEQKQKGKPLNCGEMFSYMIFISYVNSNYFHILMVYSQMVNTGNNFSIVTFEYSYLTNT